MSLLILYGTIPYTIRFGKSMSHATTAVIGGSVVDEARHPFDNAEPLWSKFMLAYRLAPLGSPSGPASRDHVPELRPPDRERRRRSRQRDPAVHPAAPPSSFAASRAGSDFDLIAMPTLSRTALAIDHDHFQPIEIDGQVVDTCRKAWYPYTLPFNFTGHPAISLPCGFGDDGLPIGLQLVGRRADAMLLQVAAVFEMLQPWADRWPPDFG